MASIKTLYGSDKLREAYPKVNENFNELNGDINVLRTRVNTIITTPIDGEAAAQELVDARDNEATLGERLERDKDIVTSHLAETVSQTINITRDLTLTGNQVVSGFVKKPKSIDIISRIDSSKAFSIGKVSQNGQNVLTRFSSDVMAGLSAGIALGLDAANYTRGNITINDDKTITIAWSKTGAGATGTVSIIIVANYHGED